MLLYGTILDVRLDALCVHHTSLEADYNVLYPISASNKYFPCFLVMMIAFIIALGEIMSQLRLELSRLFLSSFNEWRCLRCLSFCR